MLSTSWLCCAAPLRHVHVKHGLSEPITVSGTLHLSGYRFLRWRNEKWLLVFREADAILGKDRLRIQSFLGSLDSI